MALSDNVNGSVSAGAIVNANVNASVWAPGGQTVHTDIGQISDD